MVVPNPVPVRWHQTSLSLQEAPYARNELTIPEVAPHKQVHTEQLNHHVDTGRCDQASKFCPEYYSSATTTRTQFPKKGYCSAATNISKVDVLPYAFADAVKGKVNGFWCCLVLDQIFNKVGKLPSAPKRLSVRTQQKYTTTFQKASSFLQKSGMNHELQNGLYSRNLMKNMRIYMRLRRIQQLANLSSDSKTMANPVSDPMALSETLFALKVATCIYGPIMVASVHRHRNGLTSRVPFRKCVLEATNYLLEQDYLPEDMLVANWKDDARMVQNMVFVDHQRRQVFLSIRGTHTLNDVLIDLDFQNVPFCGGQAHKGAVLETLTVWNECKDALLRQAPKDYELVICGHSLGGSVGILLRIMIEHDNIPHSFSRIRNYAFSPFPCFSTNSSLTPVKDVNVVIHNGDIVPFLSLENVRRLNHHLCQIDEARRSMGIVKTMKFLNNTRKVKNPTSIKIPSELQGCLDSSQVLPELDHEASPLSIPLSRLLHLTNETDGNYKLLDHCPSLLESGIPVERFVASDHSLPTCIAALHKIKH